MDFFKTHFDLTARESVALIGGAHSFGKFNAGNSFFKYSWTKGQTLDLNNQLFRHIAAKPQYFMTCDDGNGNPEFGLVGDAYGNPGETFWAVNALRVSESGGPFQWFHRYVRCPASNNCSRAWREGEDWNRTAVETINFDPVDDSIDGAEPPTPEGCCDNLEEGMYCQPWCVRAIQNDETALASETGFYWKFNFDPDTGLPSGCPGFDHHNWKPGPGIIKGVIPDCDKEDYAPEGEALHAIVDEYADHQDLWMVEFIPSLEKMTQNGYEDHALIDNIWF